MHFGCQSAGLSVSLGVIPARRPGNPAKCLRKWGFRLGFSLEGTWAVDWMSEKQKADLRPIEVFQDRICLVPALKMSQKREIFSVLRERLDGRERKLA
jgi:hypothetical protein